MGGGGWMWGHWCRPNHHHQQRWWPFHHHRNTTTATPSPRRLLRLLTCVAAFSVDEHCGDGQMCLSPSPKPHWPPTRCSGSRHKCTSTASRCGQKALKKRRGLAYSFCFLMRSCPHPASHHQNSDSQCLSHLLAKRGRG